jgi:ABC-2 type transport system permease protein
MIFGTLFFFHMLFYFGFIYELFDISHVAHIGELLSFGLLFLSAIISLGLFLGALLPSREIATPIVLFSSLPLVFSVGFIWPLEAMPAFIFTMASFFPSTPAMQGFLALNQMGVTLDTLSPQTSLLLVQIIFYLSGAYYIESARVKRNNKDIN